MAEKSARRAEKLGYTNLKVFHTGFNAWKKLPGTYNAIAVDYVKFLIDKKVKVHLIDSRPKRSKFDKGTIPTAISLPDSKFDQMIDKLPQDKTARLIFFCEGFT